MNVGVKIGDYSTSGRTYTRVVNESTSTTSCSTVCFYVALAALVISIGVLGFITYKTPHWVAHLDVVKRDVDSGNSLFLRNVECAAKTFGDDDFRIEFPIGTLEARRVVQYCQWEEIPRVTREKLQDGTTVEHTTFSYVKGWRNNRIVSTFFDAAVAHHNPQHDPFPAHTLSARVVLDHRIHVNGKGLPARGAPQALYLTRDHFSSMEAHSAAWQRGFRSMDSRYVYHYYDRSTAGSLLHGVAQFLVDGVVGTGIRGTCEPGDIRVSYDVSFAASPVSAIVRGESVVFAAAGDASLDHLLEIQYRALMDSVWWRNHRSSLRNGAKNKRA